MKNESNLFAGAFAFGVGIFLLLAGIMLNGMIALFLAAFNFTMAFINIFIAVKENRQ